MRTAQEWMCFFQEANEVPLEVPWGEGYQLTPHEREAVAGSMQQFQLGEGSEGNHFLRCGRELRDPYFVPALAMFIRQEQRHSACLATFMEAQGIPRLQEHWVDQVFRRVRRLAGLRLMVSVLVAAEIIAVPYYRALRLATASPTLRTLCGEILREEANHLEFQADTIRRLGCSRWQAVLHRWFLWVTCGIVWREHKSVFTAAHYTWRQFWEESLQEWGGFQHMVENGGALFPTIVFLPEDALPRV